MFLSPTVIIKKKKKRKRKKIYIYHPTVATGHIRKRSSQPRNKNLAFFGTNSTAPKHNPGGNKKNLQ